MHIKRNVLSILESDIFTKSISILVGARQVGKTYLLRQIERICRQNGLKTAFFDLEQPSTLSEFNQTDTQIIQRLSNAGNVIFIDEFQYLKNASHLFKALYDQNRSIKIFASGSSALEMHKHLRESLAGRKRIHPIYPCSLEEWSTVQDDSFNDYLRFGGLPGLLSTTTDTDRINHLTDMLQSYILKDVKGLIREENIRAFNHLLYLLADNQGSLVSTHSLSKEVGLTSPTILAHLKIMSQTYILHPLYSYSSNLGNELKKSQKYYLYDIGIRNMIIKDFGQWNNRADTGVLMESLVFLELYKRLTPECELRFWKLRSGEEVDFIWIKNRKPYPIEVKTTWEIGKIPKGVAAFLKKYPQVPNAFIVHTGTDETLTINGKIIHYINIKNVKNIPDQLPR